MRSATPKHHPIVVLTARFEPGYKAGGPIRAVADGLDSLAKDISCLVVTSDRDLGDDAPYEGLSGALVERGRHEILYVDTTRLPDWWRALLSVRRARPEVLYLNSFWSPQFTMLPVLAVLLRALRPRKVILAPRGELSPGALALKTGKKRLAFPIWSLALRLCRPTMQASSMSEAAMIRKSLPWIRENEIVYQHDRGPAPAAAVAEVTSNSRFVFVGRIARMKNVLLLIESLRHVEDSVSLDIFGPIEDRPYWDECLAAIATLPEHVSVTYRGLLGPDLVQTTFAQYDGFLLPTRGENFCHAIAESLSVGCPTLCSDRTPWSDVLRAGGGEVVTDLDPHAWSAAITRWNRRSPSERQVARNQCLRAYVSWRQSVPSAPAVEVELKRCRQQRRP
ncbi:glycosyl transferase group 1 [Cellulomonas flavigena DSM 20109]|uniref:Glycosyl transferase group 1 n=2 Tax=Cellulomonas flavigena TaxID=1711 RepID=D5UJE6_CELFN|nr:glycosyl transferase group 1 [Cellulomonas flavigena DSM 20109]